MDFIYNGQSSGNVGAALMQADFDIGVMRPFVDNGKSWITINDGGVDKVIRTNATATLRYEDWKQLDAAIVKAAKERLRLVQDIRGAGLTFNIPNGMGKTVLATETQGDISDASISMDGLRANDRDRPEFEITNLPLPITHKDFSYSMRQVKTSRNGGSPLDTTTAELAARQVAESMEKLTLGTLDSYTYAGGTVYGLRNFSDRSTKSMTLPTSSGYTPANTVTEVLDMRNTSYDAKHYGPFHLYTSPNWDVYMDGDYSTAKGDNTLRERLLKIENIKAVTTLDYLTGYQAILVQMTSDVIRMVVGMEISTVQWDTDGGFKQNFKVLGIIVPQLRADFNSNTGIVHGTAT